MARNEGPVLHGQEYIPELDILVPYTLQPIPEGTRLDEARADIVPQNTANSHIKKWTVPTDALAAYVKTTPKMIENLPLPDVLNSLDLVWIEQSSDGDTHSDWEGDASGDNWSLSGSANGSSTASAAVIGELPRDRTQFWTNKLPGTEYEIYMPNTVATPLTLANIKTKLETILGATINLWPVFQPKAITLTITGGKVAVRADAQASAGRSVNLSNGPGDTDDQMSDKSFGGGVSVDYSPEMTIVEIPPSLHKAFYFSRPQVTQTCTADAAVSWIGYNFPSVNVHKLVSRSISGSITPWFIAATTPTDVPRTGLYLTDYKVTQFRWDHCLIRAEIFDASVLAQA